MLNGNSADTCTEIILRMAKQKVKRAKIREQGASGALGEIRMRHYILPTCV